MASKLYRVNATIIIFVFLLYCIVLIEFEHIIYIALITLFKVLRVSRKERRKKIEVSLGRKEFHEKRPQ